MTRIQMKDINNSVHDYTHFGICGYFDKIIINDYECWHSKRLFYNFNSLIHNNF